LQPNLTVVTQSCIIRNNTYTLVCTHCYTSPTITFDFSTHFIVPFQFYVNIIFLIWY
jgi:hypothetical protein